MTQAASRGPAHLRTLMDACGITVEDMATRLGVAPRSVRRWRHTMPAPADAWGLVDTQVEWMLTTVDTALDGLDQTDPQQTAQTVDLAVYPDDASAQAAGLGMAARHHAAAIALLALILQYEGRQVRITEIPHEPQP